MNDAPHSAEDAMARERLWDLVGGPPPGRTPRVLEAEPYDPGIDGAVGERLLLDLNDDEPVSAIFLKPEGDGPFPLVNYIHAHGWDYDLGKDELVRGRSHLVSPYAHDLIGHGYAVLAIDNWMFGDRPRHGSENALVKRLLMEGRVLLGMMLHDNAAALDYALARPDIDGGRVAVLGLSMGSTLGWWLAALDTRVTVCVDLCCLTDVATIIETGALDMHGFYYIVPGLLRQFDTGQINALIAPRAHLGLAGIHDELTPPAGLDKIEATVAARYAELGQPEAFKLMRFDCGHEEPPEMRTAALAFMKEWL